MFTYIGVNPNIPHDFNFVSPGGVARAVEPEGTRSAAPAGPRRSRALLSRSAWTRAGNTIE